MTVRTHTGWAVLTSWRHRGCVLAIALVLATLVPAQPVAAGGGEERPQGSGPQRDVPKLKHGETVRIELGRGRYALVTYTQSWGSGAIKNAAPLTGGSQWIETVWTECDGLCWQPVWRYRLHTDFYWDAGTLYSYGGWDFAEGPWYSCCWRFKSSSTGSYWLTPGYAARHYGNSYWELYYYAAPSIVLQSCAVHLEHQVDGWGGANNWGSYGSGC
jgi:hypothetical protein